MKHVIRTASATALCGAFFAFACGHIDPPDPTGNTGATGGTGPAPATGGTGNAPSTGGTGNAPAGGMSSGGTGAAPTCMVATTGTPLAPRTIAQGASPVACGDAMYQQFDPQTMPGYCEPQDPAVKQLMSSMSLDQKILQMQGIPAAGMDYNDIERSPDDSVNGIRGYRYRDAGRGVNLDAGQDNRASDGKNYATAFPVQSARGASWDLDLEYRLGEAMGDETAASKNNMLLAPCMNVIRHPYWGRTQETYSEDPYHIGRMASALTAGIQKHVAACAKHFAANNIEDERINQDAVMDEQTLREIYGRHFEMVVQDGGVSCIMAAYNKINSVKSTQSKKLLTDILRGPLSAGGMAFRGTVLSDWWAMPGYQNVPEASTGIRTAAEAATAGMDIEVPWTLHYSYLSTAIDQGQLERSAVETSAERILEQKFRFKTARTTDAWGPLPTRTSLGTGEYGGSIAGNEPHLALAEEAAIKSAVLLNNGPAGMPVLPITGTPSIVVAGLDLPINLISTTPPVTGWTLQMATHVSLGDRGSSRVNADPAKSVGPFDGIKQIGELHGVTNVTSANSVAAVTAAAPDLIVAVVGLSPGDEGEEYAIEAGGDRASLNLPHGQNEFIDGLLALNKPTVIIIQAGSITALPWLNHPTNKNTATIWAGYPGQRGGLAYGKLLFGEANFSGKMPMAWPLEADLQPFKDQPGETRMGYFFGYRHYDRLAAAGTPKQLVFPFGHGLSYTTFEYKNLTVPCTTVTEKSLVNATVDITNTGTVAGAEVAMLFVKGPAPVSDVSGAARPVKELKSFNRVQLDPGMSMRLPLPIRIQDLRRWQGGEDGNWVIDKGEYKVLVGKNAADAEANEAAGMLVRTFTVE